MSAVACCPSNQRVVDELCEFKKRVAATQPKLALSIGRAVKSVSRYPLAISSSAEARELEGIGSFLAAKIGRIVATHANVENIQPSSVADGGSVSSEHTYRPEHGKGADAVLCRLARVRAPRDSQLFRGLMEVRMCFLMPRRSVVDADGFAIA